MVPIHAWFQSTQWEELRLLTLEKRRLQVYALAVCIQQTVQRQSPGRGQGGSDGPESMEGHGREAEVQLVIMKLILPRAGLSCPGRSEMHAMRRVQTRGSTWEGVSMGDSWTA